MQLQMAKLKEAFPEKSDRALRFLLRAASGKK